MGDAGHSLRPAQCRLIDARQVTRTDDRLSSGHDLCQFHAKSHLAPGVTPAGQAGRIGCVGNIADTAGRAAGVGAIQSTRTAAGRGDVVLERGVRGHALRGLCHQHRGCAASGARRAVGAGERGQPPGPGGVVEPADTPLAVDAGQRGGRLPCGARQRRPCARTASSGGASHALARGRGWSVHDAGDDVRHTGLCGAGR